ncbi:MAG TPA: hypothetical protein VJ771_05545 [Candidatus Nitrosotalea sp.]|nr:hypothetical protein [Candidatus Nitrosotalea sp.]
MKKITPFVHISCILMLSTSAVYFLAAYLSLNENLAEHSVQIEMILFVTVGITYAPLGIWMLKNKMNSRSPYVISTVFSSALVGLYFAAKTISMPIVGLEGSVGEIDVTSKILQVAIVVISLFLLPELKRRQNYEIHGT